jgi:hypothetical protein
MAHHPGLTRRSAFTLFTVGAVRRRASHHSPPRPERRMLFRLGTPNGCGRVPAAGMTGLGLGRVKTQAAAACVEYLGGIAHRESQILLRT